MENTASHSLQGRGHETFNPRIRGIRPLAASRPLFPRYIFLRPDPSRSHVDLRSVRGVAEVVLHGPSRSIVPQGVIDEIRARQDAEGFVAVDAPPAAPPLQPGDLVEVLDGTGYRLLDAVFQETAGYKRSQLFVRLLTHFGPVVVQASRVRKADAPQTVSLVA